MKLIIDIFSMNTAVIYARVSSTGDRQTTERQVTDLKKYISINEMELVSVFEEKMSGAKENRNALYAFLGAQTFNIILTMLVAWLMFGIVKPAVWPTPKAEVAETTVVLQKEPEIIFEQPVEAPEIAFDDASEEASK